MNRTIQPQSPVISTVSIASEKAAREAAKAEQESMTGKDVMQIRLSGPLEHDNIVNG